MEHLDSIAVFFTSMVDKSKSIVDTTKIPWLEMRNIRKGLIKVESMSPITSLVVEVSNIEDEHSSS